MWFRNSIKNVLELNKASSIIETKGQIHFQSVIYNDKVLDNQLLPQRYRSGMPKVQPEGQIQPLDQLLMAFRLLVELAHTTRDRAATFWCKTEKTLRFQV